MDCSYETAYEEMIASGGMGASLQAVDDEDPLFDSVIPNIIRDARKLKEKENTVFLLAYLGTADPIPYMFQERSTPAEAGPSKFPGSLHDGVATPIGTVPAKTRRLKRRCADKE